MAINRLIYIKRLIMITIATVPVALLILLFAFFLLAPTHHARKPVISWASPLSRVRHYYAADSTIISGNADTGDNIPTQQRASEGDRAPVHIATAYP
jgi:capsular polysaccharide biosynthesis protein